MERGGEGVPEIPNRIVDLATESPFSSQEIDFVLLCANAVHASPQQSEAHHQIN